jgi:glycosyltransferase involved in cell wall biosynthesis
MKIAYVLPFLSNPGGWRSHATALLNAIQSHIQPVLFVAAGDYQTAKSLFPEQEVYSLPVTQMASLGNPRGVLKLAASYTAVQRQPLPPVDLVHSLEAYPSGLVGLWLARKLRSPLVLTAHGTYGVIWHERLLDRLAYRRVLTSARLVTPVSTGTANLMRQYFGASLKHTPLHPILNGNDFYRRVPRSQAWDHPFPDTPTLLSVGDIKARKGQLISLAAFARLKERFPEARYQIVGRNKPNAYFQDLQRLVRERQLTGVEFLGAVPDEILRQCYQQASLFVLTPQQVGLHFEGFGLVYLEAGAYGLPVVATRSGGVADAVKHGETGLLVDDPQDVDGIAEALARLLADPSLARRMGRANREWAETLTWERCAREHLQVYREIVNG